MDILKDLQQFLDQFKSNNYVLEHLLIIRKKGLEKYIAELVKLLKRVDSTLAAKILKQEDFMNEKIEIEKIHALLEKTQSLRTHIKEQQAKLVHTVRNNGKALLKKRNLVRYLKELQRFKVTKIFSFNPKQIDGAENLKKGDQLKFAD